MSATTTKINDRELDALLIMQFTYKEHALIEINNFLEFNRCLALFSTEKLYTAYVHK